jgi:SWI/SNF-related matrix-associated actin-dependent regulator 1 of chromatin subfamily A
MGLFPYQREDIRFLRGLKTGIVGHEPGLGKTRLGIGFGLDHYPVLVVCPASVKFFWQEQILEAHHAAVKVVDGQKDALDLLAPWTIINYDLLGYYADRIIRNLKPQTVIADEAHRLANMGTAWTQHFHQIAAAAERVLCLSGTPIRNRPLDLFSLLLAVKQVRLQEQSYFKVRYNGGKLKDIYIAGGRGKTRKVWEYTGATHVEELKEFCAPFFIRRTKQEVLKDLPPILRTHLMVDITTSKEYREALQEFREWMASDGRTSGQQTHLVRINKLRQLSARGKVEATQEQIEDAVSAGKKAVVFCSFLDPLHLLANRYTPQKHILLEGAVSARERTEMIERFQRDPECQVAVVSLDAGGEGVTLTAADTCIFMDLPWLPAKIAQGEGRLSRIGQRNTVNSLFILGHGTVDEALARVLRTKADVVEKFLEEGAALGFVLKEVEAALMGLP